MSQINAIEFDVIQSFYNKYQEYNIDITAKDRMYEVLKEQKYEMMSNLLKNSNDKLETVVNLIRYSVIYACLIYQLKTDPGINLGNDVEVVSHDNPKCIVVKKNMNGQKIMFVVFRGTKTFKDVMTDIKFFRCTFNPCKKVNVKAHRGFVNYYKLIQDKLNDIVYKEYRNSTHIVFCGHSMGGGLAQLALLHFFNTIADKEENRRSKLFCFTCGTPCIGDSAYVNEFKDKINFHMVHPKDSIAKSSIVSGKCLVNNEIKIYPRSVEFLKNKLNNEHIDKIYERFMDEDRCLLNCEDCKPKSNAVNRFFL